MINKLFFVILITFTTGCTPGPEEIKRFGFESLEEMEKIRKLGFLYKKEFIKSEEDKQLLRELGFSNMKEMKAKILDGLSNATEVKLSEKQDAFRNAHSKFSTGYYNIKQEYKKNNNTVKHEESMKILYNDLRTFLNQYDRNVFKWKCDIRSVKDKEIECGDFLINNNEVPNHVLVGLKAKESIRFSGNIGNLKDELNLFNAFFSQLLMPDFSSQRQYKVHNAKIITLNNPSFEKQVEINKSIRPN